MTDDDQTRIDALYARAKSTLNGYVWDEYLSDDDCELIKRYIYESTSVTLNGVTFVYADTDEARDITP